MCADTINIKLWQLITRNKPDYVFPSIHMYPDLKYSAESRTVLGDFPNMLSGTLMDS